MQSNIRIYTASLMSLLTLCGKSQQAPQDPLVISKGWKIEQALKSRNAKALAGMVSQHELTKIGMTREKATELINQFLIPKASYYSTNLLAIRQAGNAIQFIKKPGDSFEKYPPTIVLAPYKGVHVVTLSGLVLSAWNTQQNLMTAHGKSKVETGAYLKTQLAAARKAGFTKTLSFSGDVVQEVPTEPYGMPAK